MNVLKWMLDQEEKKILKEWLSILNWNRLLTSKKLGISYRCILYKIRKHGLKP